MKHSTTDEAGRARDIRALPDGDRDTIERYRRHPMALVPPATFLPIIDRLADELAAAQRTIDQLRGSNRRLARREP